ncbi:MAG: phosphoribosylformylglycinamidine synthase, partial [Prevotella sp.]|nr:phosphoribosylformylglycinamidine synthase [Prevotella sp.]
MIRFFQTPQKTTDSTSRSVIATEVDHALSEQEIKELNWLFGEATLLEAETLDGFFVGPRREMITPWSTNAVEITQNMGIRGISRIEEYFPVASKDAEYDEMLQRMYNGLNQDIFTINIQPEPIKYVDNLEEYNEQEGLALSPEEIEYLHGLEKQNGRPLTDSEIFGFAQI